MLPIEKRICIVHKTESMIVCVVVGGVGGTYARKLTNLLIVRLLVIYEINDIIPK